MKDAPCKDPLACLGGRPRRNRKRRGAFEMHFICSGCVPERAVEVLATFGVREVGSRAGGCPFGCICCMNCYMRHKVLEGDMDKYLCCQGYSRRAEFGETKPVWSPSFQR